MGLSNNIMQMLIQKAKEERSPITVNLELLPICNLHCKMCYIRSSYEDVKRLGGLKSVNEWIDIARELKDAGTLFILLTGGEVFTYPHFKELYIALYKMGFVLTINTNATLINEEVVEWLKDYPPKCVSISLYGSNDNVYERLCGQKGMFTRVNHAIELLQKYHISIECKTVLTPLNYQDLENCYQYVNDRNIMYEVATYSFPATRKLNDENQIRFSPKEMVECTFYRNKIMSDKKGYQEEIIKYLRKYEKSKDIPGKDVQGFSCSACNTSCWITWQGHMVPCAMMNLPYTLPFEIGFNKAWEELKNKVDQIALSSTCSHCDKRQVCTVCPASAYGETGCFDGTSQYHCDVTNMLLKEMYQYVEENHIDIHEYIEGE